MLRNVSITAMIAVLAIFTIVLLNDNENEVIVQEETETPEVVINVEEVVPQVVFINASFEHLTAKAQKQVLCLANNIYFEARNEPIQGQIGVAFVTLNRVSSELFPDTICEVVKQKKGKVCQFSWYCESKPVRQYKRHILTGEGSLLYNDTIDLATFVYANYEKLSDPTYGSLFYHADYVSPKWRLRLDRVATIGAHIFYRIKDET